MQPQFTSTVRCLFLLVAVVLSSAVASAIPAVVLSATADRESIVAGEPLLITVRLVNTSSVLVSFRADGDAFVRMTTAPGGARTERVPQISPGDAGFFSKELRPGSEETVRIAATETTQFTQPGEYRMSIKHLLFEATAELRFSVAPYDQPALRARAEQLHIIVALNSTADEGRLNEVALAAIEPAVSRPLLCDLLIHGRGGDVTVRRLEQWADFESVDCLIDALPGSSGVRREILDASLQRVMRVSADSGLRKKIKRTLDRR